jgi:hypothetical protein
VLSSLDPVFARSRSHARPRESPRHRAGALGHGLASVVARSPHPRNCAFEPGAAPHLRIRPQWMIMRL